MNFSAQQLDVLNRVKQWVDKKNSPVFKLFGYAGTGKTTIAKHFADGMDGDVLFGAFTGKAAHVMAQKGCTGATTIHRLMYVPQDRGTTKLRQLEQEILELPSDAAPEELEELRRLIKEEKAKLSRPMFALNQESPITGASLVIIDECSMVDERMGMDLLSFGVPVLVLGDPAQLPPVASSGFFTKGKPDFLLTEIHRQAEESPVLQLATAIREGREIAPGIYGSSSVLEKSKMDPEFVLSSDQIIVGKNKTKRVVNKRVRELLERSSLLPEQGDRLVCLRNDHDVGLLNGSIWNVKNNFGSDEVLSVLEIESEDSGGQLSVTAHSHYFMGTEDQLSFWDKKDAQEFDYGYALTCHKAQGSQWGSVLILDESRAFRSDRQRWLYTAVTRASESVHVMIDY